MAGFRDNETRDRRGRWIYDPHMPISNAVSLDLAAVRRKAYDAVAKRMRDSQGSESVYPKRMSRRWTAWYLKKKRESR